MKATSALVSIWLLSCAINCAFVFAASAKRVNPPEVPALQADEVEYRAPNEGTAKGQGVVEAWDIRTGTRLWRRKIYSVWVNPLDEPDNQWVFIKSMSFGRSSNEIVIIDERDRRYVLHTTSKRIS